MDLTDVNYDGKYKKKSVSKYVQPNRIQDYAAAPWSSPTGLIC